MNKTTFVVFIAILATMLSLFWQNYMRGREVTPAMKRFFWVSLIVGVVALLGVLILVTFK